MLREVPHGELVRRGRRWYVARGGVLLGPGWSTRRVRALRRAQLIEPVAVIGDGRRRIWLFEDRFYAEGDALEPADVLALIRERERRARRRLDGARAALARERTAAGAPRRERISADVRRAVFERDGGRCVACGSDFDIQYDHVIPFSLGGASSAENLQVLCATCNRRKGATP